MPTAFRRVGRAALLGGALWLAGFGVGCEVDNSAPGGRGSSGHDSSLDGDDRHGERDDAGGVYSDAELEPLIPEDARLVADGEDDLSYVARRDGVVYVLDRSDRKLVYETPIDEGEELVVSPDRNAIEIDGKRVSRKDLKKKHRHKIFFERESSRSRPRR